MNPIRSLRSLVTMLAAQTVPTRGAFQRPKAFTSAPSRGRLQVTNAVTRQKKEEIVSTLKEKLDGSVIVFGMRFKGLDVGTVQKFRKGLPEGASAFVCKNNLMKVAISQTEGWSQLAEGGCTGENAWIFVSEDAISDTIKHYFKFEDDLFAEAKKVAPKNVEVKKPTEVSVVVMDNKLLSAKELKACEKLPTKKQLLATIASLAKQPAKKIAVGVKAVPTKLAIALKKVSELDEDKTKTLAQVVKA